MPLFLDAFARLLDDDARLTPEQQAKRVLSEVYGCTPALCTLDFPPQATSYEDLVQGIARGVALERVLAAGSQQELATRLGSGVAGWGTAEKLALIQHVGRRLRDNYDHSEVLNGPRRRLAAIDLVRGYQEGRPTGICGAIANTQAWMLRELGFRDAFVLTSRNLFHPHATVIVRSPDLPGTLIKVDYDHLSEASLAAETAGLSQPHDESTSYFIYRVDGGLVANLTTELGLLLHEWSGGQPGDLDTFARQTATAVASVSVTTGRTGAALTAAHLSDGTSVYSLMGQVRAGPLAAGRSGFAAELGGGPALQTGVIDGYAVPALYARAALRYGSPWVGSRALQTRTEASAHLMSRVHLFDFRGEPLRNRANVTQRLRIEARDGRTTTDLRIGTQYLYHFDDPRDNQHRRLARNYWFVDGTGRRLLGGGAEGVASLGVGLRNPDLGPQIEARLAFRRDDGTAGAEVGYRGRTNADRLSLAPGSARTLFASVHKDLNGWACQATYEHSLEGYPAALRIGASWVR